MSLPEHSLPEQFASLADLREAMARVSYARNEIRIVDPDLAGQTWLAATHSGLFAVTPSSNKLIAHGWFFGLCRHGDTLYLFENCAHRDRSVLLGRILRFDLTGDWLDAGQVIATGLHTNCHQIRVIDGLLCVVDTGHQSIIRLSLDGEIVDVQRPFPIAPPWDTSGAYMHINSIAAIDDRIGLILHNGRAEPAKPSEIAWLDRRDWRLLGRQSLPGYRCHDIVADEDGVLWHCDSLAGDLMSSDGRRVHVSDRYMTRGLVITKDAIIVGLSDFGPRHLRSKLRGGVVILGRDLGDPVTMMMHGAPADIVAL